jgi:hypothetical protein
MYEASGASKTLDTANSSPGMLEAEKIDMDISLIIIREYDMPTNTDAVLQMRDI